MLIFIYKENFKILIIILYLLRLYSIYSNLKIILMLCIILAMQEEVLKLVLLALEDGSALSRKVLVMFVVQRLEPHFPQASKTSIGHVVQLLYRASCFKVIHIQFHGIKFSFKIVLIFLSLHIHIEAI